MDFTPGPTINVTEGDTVIVHVLNEGPYDITLHWHGVFQLFSVWADGPEYITQCTISPTSNYTYKFNVTQQEGTVWWHAHASYLLATVHGAFIIQPRSGKFPFPTPYEQVPIILGDFYSSNVEDIASQAQATGGSPEISYAFTINGLISTVPPNCTENETFKMKVKQGKTYMLRMINAALNYDLFFKIANHNFTVVAVDASYTRHYHTDTIVIAPGQSVDVLFEANQPVGSYYMVASPYAVNLDDFDTNIALGTVIYHTKPIMPILPAFNDTDTVFKFYSNIKSKVRAPHWVPVPRKVDEHMLITIGFNLEQCNSSAPCQGPDDQRFSSSMNNESFVFPTDKHMSMLEAFYNNVSGVYDPHFPDTPPLMFDFTNLTNQNNTSLLYAPKSTKAKRVGFNKTVEIILQNTALLGGQNHPMHLHGYSFHVLAQGFGNFNNHTDRAKFNLRNPQIRNTIGVPVGGWAVIRFRANNPGIWLMHCHMQDHVPWGLAMTFEVGDVTSIPPPPADLPKCSPTLQMPVPRRYSIKNRHHLSRILF